MVIDTWPQFLGDGKQFVVRSRTYKGHLDPARSEVLLGALNSGERRVVFGSRYPAAVTSSGEMFFERRGALMAQRLDLGRGRLVGEPRVVAEDLALGNEGIQVEISPGMLSAMGPAAFSVSDNGVLVYHSRIPQRNQLVWFDRQGKRLGTVGETREYTQLSLSPDERWAAVGIRNRERKGVLDQTLWLMQLESGVLSRLSYGAGQDADPVWSPDSRRIVYGAFNLDEGVKTDLMEVILGEATPRLFYADGYANKPEAWSRDGRVLLYRRNEQLIFSLPVSGDRKPKMLLDSRYVRGRFQFSPDGRWLAYASTESGQSEVYVSSYPAMTSTRQVSTGGGSAPVWRRDGKELFYMAEDGRVISVEVKAGSILETGPPRTLFHPSVRVGGFHMGQYGVAAHGQKFLVVESPRLPGGDTRTHVVSQWDAARLP
jgi:dipeptidyl aminopeptidase/acylaminoacyl peptidase